MTPAGAARWALLEAVTATVMAAGLIRLQVQWGGWFAQLSPAVWIYLPLVLLALRRLSWAEHGFALSAWRKGGRWLLRSVALVLLPFALVALSWQWMGRHSVGFSPEPFTTDRAFYQLLMIAVPEELFFRGYVQTRLRAWSHAHGITGLAMPILLTGGLFALAHVVVAPGWRRAAVFFPSLVMSWLRDRSSGLLAPTGFHWLANLVWLFLGF